ncbi:hypothetical protein LQ318_01980 [Aliifodinibius salicampi]|uniref:Oxygen tolerance n=1 Tax=Fodinibius salicampi TaxID=1920655 RepID=A0ABT3PUY0_9BACT|nr:hypothetical protein [Fodinibius salicampi]MCW9711660.1 hypothetical protein [Fodinibius salicampi]
MHINSVGYGKLFKRILLLWLFTGITLNSSGQTVKEYTSADSLKVGDRFNFSITVNYDEDYDRITFPDSANFSSNFEIRSQSRFQVSSFKDSISYDLQFFATSDTILSPLPVLLINEEDTTTVYTNPVPIKFSSVLAEEDESLRPLKPIYDFAAAWWPYIIGFLLLLIVGFLLYYYLTKKEKEETIVEPQPFKPKPFINPLKVLEKDINRLEQMDLSSTKDFQIFYTELGDAIRRYFEELHQIRALELTSTEILQKLRSRSIDYTLIDDTRAVLQEADMVKFANFTPTEEQAGRALKKGYNFLERAKEIDAPRVEHMRREHQSRVEAEREEHKERQNQQEVEA